MDYSQNILPKILCLSFWAPPVVRPQSLLIGKMLPEWQRQGLRVGLVSYENESTEGLTIPNWYIPKPPSFHRFFSLIPFYLRHKNNQYLESLVAKILPIIKEFKPDVIFSFSNPQDSNVVGAFIHKKTGVPFVAHFSDPWYDNPYKKRIWGKRSVKKSELMILNESSRAVFPAIELQNLVMKKFPNVDINKGRVIPHCFDETAYLKEIIKPNPQFVFSHIGAFYRKLRTPDKLFAALLPLATDRLEFKLRLIGASAEYSGYKRPELFELINKYGLNKYVEIWDTTGYAESLRQMQDSGALIVIDADIVNSPFLPSKVVDYLGAHRPIIGITPSGSPTDLLLKKIGSYSFNYKQTKQLTDCCRNIISRKIVWQENLNVTEMYSVKSTTKQYIELFSELIKE